MKASLLLTALIPGTAALAGWFQHRAAALDLVERDRLRAEVLKLGIDPDWLTAQAKPGNLTPRKNAQVLTKADAATTLAAREASVRAIAREIIAFAKSQKETEKSGNAMDAGAQKRAMAVFEQLLDFKEEDFAILLEEVRSDPSLPKQAQGEMIGMSVMMLAQQNPRSALKLLLESKDQFQDNPGSGFMATMAIGLLAETDPAAAFAWMEEHKDSGFVNDMARQQALAGLAKADPEQALRNIFDQKADPTAKDGTFNSVRFAGSIAHGIDRDALLAGIGAQLVRGGFETAAPWLESSTLSREEKSQVPGGLAGGLHGTDPAPWLDLLQKIFPQIRSPLKPIASSATGPSGIITP